MDELSISSNEIISRIAKIKGVYALYLFGSRVNGKARKDSDLDLAVFTDNISRKKELEIIGCGFENIDVSIFNRLPLIIQFRVFRDGKLVFCKDTEKLHRVRVNTYRNYLDFAVFINNFYARLLKNV